jgi:hypothetical protein
MGWTARSLSSSPCRAKNFLFSTASRPALRPTQSPIQWVPEAVSPGVKCLGCEADHLPSTSGKEWWSYTSTPQYILMAAFAVCKEKHVKMEYVCLPITTGCIDLPAPPSKKKLLVGYRCYREHVISSSNST